MLSNVADMSIYQIIAELIEIPCRVVLLFVLWNRFVPLFSGESKKDKNKIYILAVIVTATEILRCLVVPYGFPLWLLTMCGIPLFYAYIYKRESMPETLFSLLLFVNYRYLSYFVVNSIMDPISKVMMTGIENSSSVEAYANYLGRFETEGIMNQPDFFRAIDTVGKDITTPAYIDDLGYKYWNGH